MTTADFLQPVTVGMTAQFITARAAARHMIEQGSGVLPALNSGSAHGSPVMGGTGPADAAIDTYLRNLAAELGIWATAIPDTCPRTSWPPSTPGWALDDAGFAGLLANLDQMRLLRRSPRLTQIIDLATFLASDRAGGITGTFVNATGMPLHS